MSAGSSTAKKMLVVDGDASARLLMRAALHKSGHDVVLAASGDEAMRKFRENGPFDMVLLDVELPNGDGHRVCAALRDEAGELLPIMMVTRIQDVQSIARGYDAGATDFIVKPINWPLLAYRVKHLLRVYQAMAGLRAAEARNIAILAAIPDQLFELDGDGRYVDFHSPRDGSHVAGRELVGRTVHEVLPGHAAKICISAIQAAAQHGSSTGKVFKLDSQEGEFWFELSVAKKSVEPGAPPRFLVLSRNITERMTAEYRIRKMAFFDSLTGLPNREYFMRRLERHVQRAKAGGTRFAVLFMDLDGFKNINDTLGHSAGDRLLRAAAERLSHGMRPAAAQSRPGHKANEVELARLGGDEFISLVLDLTSREDASAVAQALLDVMRQPFAIEGRHVTLTTSIGIAIYPEDGTDPATLLKHGDTAMYHAKDSGRDNSQFYSTTLTRQVVRNLELDGSLRTAAENNQLLLLYQPQFDVASGSIQSVEALLRWSHPSEGFMLPHDFIPLAERNGTILPIGRWALRTACAQAVRWLRAGRPTRIAVNISALQWKDPRLLETVFETLSEVGLPPELLELELTESAVMMDVEGNLSKLHALRERGVRIALDDFGTGYSSLSYLSRMPLTSVKVDRSFVAGLAGLDHNRAIVRAVLAMARSLDLSVAAEGVETVDQAMILQAMACDVLQGFLFSPPVAASEIPALLKKRWPQLPATSPTAAPSAVRSQAGGRSLHSV